MRPAAGGPGGTDGRDERRADQRDEVQPRKGPPPAHPGVIAAVAIGLPVVAIALGEGLGSGPGALFAIGSVLAAILTVLLVTRRGLWWAVPAPPLVIGVVSFAGEEIARPPRLHDRTALAIWAAHWAVRTFPVMAAAEVAAICAAVFVLVRAQQGWERAHR